MNNSKDNLRALKFNIQTIARDAILEIFGVGTAEQSMGKMFGILDLSTKLGTNDLTVTVKFSDLVKAKKEWEAFQEAHGAEEK
jgi:hypothetical protein|tara:strand:+ start:339 stop:587 length:249 start_codon:yes stop_codon:yes gene_type:complete